MFDGRNSSRSFSLIRLLVRLSSYTLLNNFFPFEMAVEHILMYLARMSFKRVLHRNLHACRVPNITFTLSKSPRVSSLDTILSNFCRHRDYFYTMILTKLKFAVQWTIAEFEDTYNQNVQLPLNTRLIIFSTSP